MSELGSLLGSFAIFDLTKVGTAYQIINSFVDDAVVHVFEISPIGTRAIIILVSQDKIALQFAYQQSMSFYKADILASVLIEDLNEEEEMEKFYN